MKALVVRQPWATLIATGHKTIETRPSPPNGPMRPKGVRGLPGCSLERGERIAIVAGAAKPDAWSGGGHFVLSPHIRGVKPALWVDDGCDDARRCPNGAPLHHVVPLHRGAVVCTVTVDDALPMEPCPPYSSSFDDRWEPEPPSVIYCGGLDGGPWAFVDGEGPIRFTDQLPLGDFSPGRWGWLLSDPQPITKPEPCIQDECRSPSGTDLTCPYYDDCGVTPGARVPAGPIPCKGRQGVFELPADIAEAVQP